MYANIEHFAYSLSCKEFAFWAYLLPHPARGAWIEVVITMGSAAERESHPARGAWIEAQEITRIPKGG